jgi:hypothetical protein
MFKIYTESRCERTGSYVLEGQRWGSQEGEARGQDDSNGGVHLEDSLLKGDLGLEVLELDDIGEE